MIQETYQDQLWYHLGMSNFNYFKGGAWFNPAGEVEKTTNEMPEEEKAKTTTKKAKKAPAKKKAKKTIESK